MKRIPIIIASMIALLLLAGCGQSPKKTAKLFAENVAEGNISEAKKYTTDQGAKILDMASSMGAIETNPDFKFVLVEEWVDDNKATVEFKDGKDGKTESVDLMKIDGEWKVDVDK